MQTIVLYLCYIVLILLFLSAYNTSLIYCFVIWCLHTNKRRPCSSTLSGHPSSSFCGWFWFVHDLFICWCFGLWCFVYFYWCNYACFLMFYRFSLPFWFPWGPPRLHHGHADVADGLQSHGDVFADAFDLDHGCLNEKTYLVLVFCLHRFHFDLSSWIQLLNDHPLQKSGPSYRRSPCFDQGTYMIQGPRFTQEKSRSLR